MIARMQIRKTAWDALLANQESAPESIQRILRQGATQEIKDAQNPAGFILMNVIGSATGVDELWDYFSAGDKQSRWNWNFNGKVDFETEYTGQHNDILATQPAGSTFEDGNWSHYWMGQGDSQYIQRYARGVTRGMGSGYA